MTSDANLPSQADATPGVGAAPAKSPRRAPRLLVLLLLIGAVVAGGYFGYRYWQDQALYITTDNALVTGSLVQVGSLNAGRLLSVAVDVGDRVAADQEVATVTLPAALTTTGSGTRKMGFRDTGDQVMGVLSPIDGVVVARQANPGDTIAAGQALLILVDPNKLWVQAQIEETKIGRVHPGQPVEVTVDTLGQVLPGRVVAINRVTAATFSLIPQDNTSGNFTKVTQLVPVKIAVAYGQTPLVLGSSVEVKIWARE
jgi:multidrug resistance efflux pump